MTRVRVLEEGAVTEQVEEAIAARAGVEGGFAPLDSGLLIPAVHSRVKSVAGRTGNITLAVADVSGAEATANKGVAGGYASLDGSGKVPVPQIPDTVVGALDYQGVWNASTNTPAIGSGSPSKGDYYKVSVAGTTSLSGITDWAVGDWAVFNGTSWDKIDNTEQVTSVDGRQGAVDLSDKYAQLTDARLRQIRDEGSALTNRAILDFVGAGVTVTDDGPGGRTQVSISGAAASDASETVRGVVEEATTTETRAGTVDLPYVVSPAKLMDLLSWANPTFEDGCNVEWQSATQVIVRKGVVYIPGVSKLVELAADVTINFASGGTTPPVTGTGTLTVNKASAGWVYIYIDSSGQVVVSTTAPASPYRGRARTMSANTSTRYRRGLYFTAANVQRRYTRFGELIRWVADIATDLRAGSGLTATVGTDLDISPLAPPTSDGVFVSGRLLNADLNSTAYIAAAGDGLMSVGGSENAGQLTASVLSTTATRVSFSGPVSFAGSTVLRHRQTLAGASRDLNIDIQAYYERTA